MGTEEAVKEKKITLKVGDRMIFGEVFAIKPETDRLEAKIINGILEKITLTNEEIEEFGITFNGNGANWDNPKARGMKWEIPLDNPEIEVLKNMERMYETQKKYSQRLLMILDKILEL